MGQMLKKIESHVWLYCMYCRFDAAVASEVLKLYGSVSVFQFVVALMC